MSVGGLASFPDFLYITPGGEGGFVAQMEEDHAVQPVTFEHRPSATKHMLRFIIAVPGEFDSRMSSSLRQSAVYLAIDRRELELAEVVAFELDERLAFLGVFLNVPLIHMFDCPTALKQICRFSFRHCTHHRWSNVVGHFRLSSPQT